MKGAPAGHGCALWGPASSSSDTLTGWHAPPSRCSCVMQTPLHGHGCGAEDGHAAGDAVGVITRGVRLPGSAAEMQSERDATHAASAVQKNGALMLHGVLAGQSGRRATHASAPSHRSGACGGQAKSPDETGCANLEGAVTQPPLRTGCWSWLHAVMACSCSFSEDRTPAV